MAISPRLATRTFSNMGREQYCSVRSLPAVAAIAAGLLLAPAADAARPFKRCGGYGYSCSRVIVPLDRTGTVPGRVSLYVKRVRAERRPSRGAVFALAGGPGQSATQAFAGDALGIVAPAYRRRDLIVYDQRGTGRSGALRCLQLERANILDAGDEAARCAEQLGPKRAFYTTPDSVEDIEAIRRELGYGRIALYGTSYGTKVALAYALRYPANVERLVLDSVVEAAGPDPLYLDTMQAVPRVLRSLCRRACRFTPDPVADVEALVAQLAQAPLTGTVFGPRGRGRRTSMTSAELFAILVAGDFDPLVRGAFPGAVRAALQGDAAPLLRLRERAIMIETPPARPRLLSAGLYAATTCEESLFPWDRTAAPQDRRGQAAARVEAMSPEAFRPFDRATALGNDLINLCAAWPAAPAAPVFGAGPLPDVPVLLLEGEDDLRTPVENAQRVAAEFPQARLYVVAATGHSALGSDVTGCTDRAFARFFTGRRLPGPCRRFRKRPRPDPPPPTRLAQLEPAPGVRGRPGRAVRAVNLTLRDVSEDYSTALFASFFGPETTRGGGLRGGRWSVRANGTLRLRKVRFMPGVRVTGRVVRFQEPGQRGRLRVAGPGTPDGRLVLRGKRIRGRLGGRRVRTRFRSGTVLGAAARTPARPRPDEVLPREP
jgi:pimeloyl-ACP methyl ester carboxylesterase